jgi:hypothetical protein
MDFYLWNSNNLSFGQWSAVHLEVLSDGVWDPRDQEGLYDRIPSPYERTSGAFQPNFTESTSSLCDGNTRITGMNSRERARMRTTTTYIVVSDALRSPLFCQGHPLTSLWKPSRHYELKE